MVFGTFPDFPQVPVCTPEQMNGQTAAAVTSDPEDETTLALLAAHMGAKLLLPEFWAERFPQCGVLISSAICGGTLSQRFEEAAFTYPHRCWLLLEPVCMEFPLPCPTGTGTPIDTLPGKPHFFSESLCCYYTHFIRNEKGYLTLFDTEETLRKKLELAREAGFLGFAHLETTRSS